MRRGRSGAAVLRLAAVSALALAGSVPASAVSTKTIVGTAGADVLHGTPGADVIRGRGGNDRLYGEGGADVLVGGAGVDRLYGGAGADRVVARDGSRDFVSCGGGRDVVVLDELDRRAKNCENVSGVAGETSPTQLGRVAIIGRGWSLRVIGVMPDATSQILRLDRSNKPPAAGRQFFLVKISAKRTGARPGYLHAGWRLRAAGSSGKYSTFANPCGRIPDTDLDFADPLVFPGAVLEGYVCWSVRSSDADDLTMYVVDGTRVSFALRD